MQISLKQARRVEREIGTELDINVAHGLGGHINVSIHENFEAKLKGIQKSTIESALKDEKLLGIRFKIRKMIETENEVGGLNKLMNREAELRAVAKSLTSKMSAELTHEEYLIAVARHDAAVKSGGVQSHYGLTDTVAVHNTLFTTTLDILRDKSKAVQRELLQVVDKLSALNTTRTIDLSTEDAKALEAYNIIVTE